MHQQQALGSNRNRNNKTQHKKSAVLAAAFQVNSGVQCRVAERLEIHVAHAA
jgi:hypothetical protein